MTLTHARVGFAARGDSGVDVARQLSLAVVERDPSDIRKQDLLKEADFIAVGTGGDDLPLAAFENLLPSKILFTGFHGDKIWARENDHVTNDIVRGDPSGASLENWRLKVGFLNLPVPFLGCTQHPSVHAISNSEEMRPWSVAPQEYDRPIPRRIVESAGVLRGTFALEKKAAATPYQTTGLRNPPLASVLSPAAHKSYSEFVAVRKLRPGLVASIENRAMHALYRLNLRVIHSRLRNWIKLPGCAMDRPLVPWRYSKPLSQGCYLFHWAVQRLCAEHRAALAHDLGRSPHHADA